MWPVEVAVLVLVLVALALALQFHGLELEGHLALLGRVVVAPAQLGLQLLGSGHGRFHLASTKKCHSSVGFVPTSATAGLFGCPSLISTSS